MFSLHKNPEEYRRTLPPELRRAPWSSRLPERMRILIDILDGILAGILSLLRRIRFRAPIWMLLPVTLATGIAIGYKLFTERRAASEVIVSIQGERVTAPELFHRMEIAAGPKALRDIVYERTLVQFARVRHALPTADEVAKRAARNMSQPGAESYIVEHHIEPQDMTNAAQLELIQENLYAAGVDVSEAETEAFYRAQSDPRLGGARYYIPESARIQVVVTFSQAEADKAWQQWRDGLSFDAVVATYSKDASAQDGGILPIMYRGRSRASMIPGLEDLIFKMTPGEVSRPRRFAAAWWMMLCVSRTPATKMPFEQVKDECRMQARVLKGQQLHGSDVRADFERYKASINTQVFWDRYFYDVVGRYKRSPPRTGGPSGDASRPSETAKTGGKP